MKLIILNRLFNILFVAASSLLIIGALEGCSKKSNASKTTVTETKEAENPPPAPVKDGMEIKRDAAGNYVINLTIKDMEAVKLMKPVKEGYVVWMQNESRVTTSIGTIDGADTWTDKKDVVRFTATSPVKPARIFITAETDLKVQKPGTQMVWSTRNF